MKKRITLKFDLGQVCNDVLAKCNLISKSLKDEAAEDIKASIQNPDDPETRSIINRAVTEAVGRVKVACQRYLTVGRTDDDNRLERLVKSVVFAQKPFEVQATDDSGHLLFKATYGGEEVVVYKNSQDEWVMEDGTVIVPEDTPEELMTEVMMTTDIVTEIIYESVTLVLEIRNFNLAVTDDLKSWIHKFIVDYVMYRFLQDQHPDKAAEYKAMADGEDYSSIIKDLNARESYTMRTGSWM